MAINFKFVHIDDNKRYAHDKSLPLVKFILCHLDFLPYLCDCITTYTTVGSLERVDERGKNVFSKYLNTLDFEDEDNYDYIGEFEELFREAYRIDLTKYNEDVLGDIRGKVLEDLIEELVKPRYTDRSNPFGKIFNVGCRIEFNGKHLTIPTRKTVDIAGWDGIIGEFYEAKVGPHRFQMDELILLTLIKNEMDKHCIQCIVGCVSMKRSDVIKAHIKNIVEKEKIPYNHTISIYGKDNLLALQESPLSILA